MARLALLLLALALGGAAAQIRQVQLAYDLDDLDDTIDAQTMRFHYGVHYSGYVNNTNKAIAEGGAKVASKTDLAAILRGLPDPTSELGRTLRNQGGGAWNHGLFFRHLAPAGSADTQAAAISPPLAAAINASFGSLANMTDAVNAKATKVFGSGWAWLCASGASLSAESSPNQDNPLMPLAGAPRCVPILGVDVWEHAYYLKHGPKRANWLKAFWQTVNWTVVSKSFTAVQQGKISALVA